MAVDGCHLHTRPYYVADKRPRYLPARWLGGRLN